jgi:hypothetical protein
VSHKTIPLKKKTNQLTELHKNGHIAANEYNVEKEKLVIL